MTSFNTSRIYHFLSVKHVNFLHVIVKLSNVLLFMRLQKNKIICYLYTFGKVHYPYTRVIPYIIRYDHYAVVYDFRE